MFAWLVSAMHPSQPYMSIQDCNFPLINVCTKVYDGLQDGDNAYELATKKGHKQICEKLHMWTL